MFLPAGDGPHPVVILIHGGCWSATTAGREQVRQLGAELARDGIAVWSIGSRRANEDGSGYPGTFLDVGTAIDRLRDEVPRLRLDLTRTVLVGHSAGGHLALWAASRDRLPAGSAVRVADPFVPAAARAYAHAVDAQRTPPVELVDIPGAGHFDVVTPGTPAWSIIRTRIAAALAPARD